MLAAGCNQAPPPDTRAADAQAITDGGAQMLKAAQAHDVDGVAAAYADDAVVMPNDAPIATNKAEIRAVWAAMLAPGVSLAWQSSKLEVATGGDIAYDQGTSTLTLTDAKGVSMSEHGKYLTEFKKQANGKWMVVEDIWNADVPPPPPMIVKNVR
jgi:uncharacterized protein (TIGR02246 family)